MQEFFLPCSLQLQYIYTVEQHTSTSRDWWSISPFFLTCRSFFTAGCCLVESFVSLGLMFWGNKIAPASIFTSDEFMVSVPSANLCTEEQPALNQWYRFRQLHVDELVWNHRGHATQSVCGVFLLVCLCCTIRCRDTVGQASWAKKIPSPLIWNCSVWPLQNLGIRAL